MTPIAPLIETFLRDTLARQRGASRHTSNSYALSFQLLFVFAADCLRLEKSAAQKGISSSMLPSVCADAGRPVDASRPLLPSSIMSLPLYGWSTTSVE